MYHAAAHRRSKCVLDMRFVTRASDHCTTDGCSQHMHRHGRTARARTTSLHILRTARQLRAEHMTAFSYLDVLASYLQAKHLGCAIPSDHQLPLLPLASAQGLKPGTQKCGALPAVPQHYQAHAAKVVDDLTTRWKSSEVGKKDLLPRKTVRVRYCLAVAWLLGVLA